MFPGGFYFGIIKVMQAKISYKKSKILDILIEAVYLAVIILVPLYFSVVFPTFNVFELGKTILFHLLTLLFSSLTLIKIIFSPNSGRLFLLAVKTLFIKKRYYLIPLIFIIGLGISICFSGDWRQSFFGSYHRQAGYLSYLYYFSFFSLLSFNLLTAFKNEGEKLATVLKRKIKRFLVSAVISGTIVAVYAILQILGIDFLTWAEAPVLTGRAFSSLGQVNFLASWLLFIIPLSVYLAYREKHFLGKFLYGLGAATQTIALFSTGSRGGLLAFWLLILFFLGLACFRKIMVRYRWLLGASAASLIIASVLIVNFLMPGRFQGLLDIRSGSLAARWDFYQAAVQGSLEKPLLGYGLDNIEPVFIERYETDWGIHSNIAVKNDRAHNLFLDWLLFGGIFSLGLLLLLYYYGFRLAHENIRRQPSGPSLALIAGISGYALSLFFSFSFVSGELYFFAFLVLLLVINITAKEDDIFVGINISEKSCRTRQIIWRALLGLFFLVVITDLASYEIRHYRADNYFQKLNYYLLKEDYRSVDYFLQKIKAEKINPVSSNYYYLVWAEFFSENYQKINDDNLRIDGARWLRDAQERIGVKSFEQIFVGGKIAAALGDFKTAEESFKTTADRSPYWPKSYIELGRVFVRLGRVQDALVYYQLALEVLPDENDARFNDDHRGVLRSYHRLIFEERGDLYSLVGDYQAAENDYQAAYYSGVNNIIMLDKIATTYYLRGDLNRAFDYILRGAKLNPTDYHWPTKAAILLKEQGRIKEAKDYLNQALELAPEADILLQLKNEL